MTSSPAEISKLRFSGILIARSEWMRPQVRKVPVLPGEGSPRHTTGSPGWKPLTDDPIVRTMPGECVRTKLSNLSEILSHLHGFCLLVGYKVEVAFFRREDEDGAEPFVNRKCSAMTFEMRSLLPMVETVVGSFWEEQVPLERYHSELSTGQ
ncbi:hypothetical protein PENSOL_c002G11513 [Penicillium solitum]|uniref:Uncharacterized protein n=1 Tax=Penicillium solitum TaxID=60172 RepID=A0A1V6RLV6_9EURO|nr:uncharacterized protein PENSOL_c002G11513 [Penicillium solitum]OQE02333.1 hypothetical protein PENSOL_c002G11513 [Penicillium solitum]